MYTFVGTLLVLGVAVLVHELGHFLIARRNGVRVEEFCIGFPPRIFKIKRGDTQYSVGIIPIGGFVKMAGEDPEAVQGMPDEFFSQSVPVRIRIALAGPFGNFVCAYLCILLFLWTGGVQEMLYPPVLGTSSTPGVYEKIGVAAGDRIISVRGQVPETFSDVLERIQSPDSWPAELVFQRDSAGVPVTISLDSSQAAQFIDAAYPMVDPVVSKVMEEGPAARAGIQSGDRIVEINDTPISEWNQLQRLISASAGETLALGIVRSGARLSITIVPDALRQQNHTGDVEKVGRIGIQPAVRTESHRYGFLDGLWAGAKMVVGFIRLFFGVLWHLVTGGLSYKLLGGPVGIAQVAGESLKQGSSQFLMFLSVINANLGFVNLLPFFLVTDGGLIFLFGIEAVRRRKMSIKGLERWNKVGWMMVMSLLIMATWNDLMIRLDLGEKISRAISKVHGIFG